MRIVGIAKIFISFVLVIVYFILFGFESLRRLQDGDITITRNDEFLENITSPGSIMSENEISLALLDNYRFMLSDQYRTNWEQFWIRIRKTLHCNVDYG